MLLVFQPLVALLSWDALPGGIDRLYRVRRLVERPLSNVEPRGVLFLLFVTCSQVLRLAMVWALRRTPCKASEKHGDIVVNHQIHLLRYELTKALVVAEQAGITMHGESHSVQPFGL